MKIYTVEEILNTLENGRKGQNWKNNIGLDKPKGETFLEWIKK